MNLLKINSISKKFGVLQALNEVNISIEKNTFHGLIGPNGSGTVSYTHLTLPTKA